MKKVVCINNEGYSNLTIGKIYHAINTILQQDEYICIQETTCGIMDGYFMAERELFVTLEEYRNEKIDKLLAE